MSLWSEVKQRRITQIVLTYLAGGWMVLAVVDQVVDREVLPPVVYRVFLTLYLFGIAVALILGWYHGEKGHQQATRTELILVSLVTLAGLGFSYNIVRKDMAAASLASTIESSTMDLRRVAVLYFQDESLDGSLAPIAEGLTDGLIRTLADVPELDVVSRNGSNEVRGLSVSADSMAAILNAGTLITGSVAQNRDELRVTVRLVDGQSGSEIQRDQYSWPADSLTSVGNKLAEEVSQSLRVLLGQEIRVREGRSGAPSNAAWLQIARGETALRNALEAIRAGDADAAATNFDLADQELARGQAMDETWTDPMVLRARVAYERVPLATTMEELLGNLDAAEAFADQALDVQPDNAGAMEIRGTARYRRWLMTQADLDENASKRLLDQARTDLESAKTKDRTLAASVNSVLSHLYYQVEDWQMAVLAARQAYEEDAFLAAADGVLFRLYLASYDLGRYDDAKRWCMEGGRRFPDNFRFLQCQIVIMTMTDAQPDIDEAWSLYARIEPVLPEGQKELLSGIIRTFIGGIIGRAGLPDSANAVFAQSRLDNSVDPVGEQLAMEAAMRSVIGDVEGSVETLQLHMMAAPGSFPDEHWWWRNVEGSPEFQRLKTIR